MGKSIGRRPIHQGENQTGLERGKTMREKILQAIRKNEIQTYSVTEKTIEGAELYFIKKDLDMRRMKKDAYSEVTIYRDFEVDGKKMRGSADINIFPEMTQEEVDKAVSGAFYAASFVKNPYFEIPKGKKEDKVEVESTLYGKSLEEIGDVFVKALYCVDVHEDAFINTAEFFMDKTWTAIYNSEGVDVSYEKNSVRGEFVVQCITPQDVEQYQEFAYDDLDTEALTRQAEEALARVRDRANATEAPEKGNYKLLLSGKELRQLMDFYMRRSSSGMIYPGYSNYKMGMNVQGDEVRGEKLNLTLHASAPYSSEGIPMKDLELLKKGELKAIPGNARFAYYLGVEPTGNYSAVKLDNGTKTFEEMKQDAYLYVVSFSDFSMDSFSGYFGGEIRLAYLSDGEKVTPVTGGSVSGNLLELQKDMTFSTERYKDKDYDGPFAVEFHGVAVAGK